VLRASRRFVRIDPAHVVFREGVRGQDRGHALRLPGCRGHVQNARSPVQAAPRRLVRQHSCRSQERRAGEARVGVVGQVERRSHDAQDIAGGLLRGLAVPLDQLDVPAARGERMRGPAAGKSRADDNCMALGCGRPGLRAYGAGTHGSEHLALAPEPRALFERKAGLLQAAAHGSGDRPRGCGSSRPAYACKLAKERLGPHCRIFGWRKSVEEDGIDARIQLRQHCSGVAEEQGEGDAAAGEIEPVEALNGGWPQPSQLGRGLGELAPARVRPGEISGPRRMLLDRNVIQPRRSRRVGQQRRSAGEVVEAEAEPDLEDRVRASTAPAPRQIVACEKDCARLRRTTVGGMVYVVEILGVR
jgi:hypothetical protein